MDHTKKSTYLFSIDALRVIAILAVVLIHQTTTTLQYLDHNVAQGFFSFFINQASRFAVPLFFLISGYVLELNYGHKPANSAYKEKLTYFLFFKKRASRILVPFVFWSGLYFLINSNFNFSDLLSFEFFNNLLTGEASYHLYFIPTLIIFYLLFPLLHKLIAILKNPIVLAILFLLQLTVAFSNYYVKPIPIQEDLRVALLIFIMFIIGMVSSHKKTKIIEFSKKYFGYIISLTTALLALIVLHVFEMSLRLKTTSFIYNQYGPLNYFYTIFVSLSVGFFLEKTHFLKNWFIALSKLSFFVFFVHVLILQNVWNLFIKNFVTANGSDILKNFWFDPLVFLVVCLLSFSIAYLVHKIPYAAKLTG